MILTILKIIGIILLMILLLILLILALVLFAPIKYRFMGEYFEQPDVYANVRYFPVALNAQVSYNENKLEYTIRALGGVILTNTNAKLSWLGRKISAGMSSNDLNENDLNNIQADNKESDNNDFKSYALDNTIDDSNNKSDNSVNVSAINLKQKKKDKSNNKKHSKKKSKRINNKEKTNKKSLKEMISEKIGAFKKKYTDIKEKLSKINKKKEALLKVYHSKRFEKAKSDVIKYIKYLISSIKPKHLEGRVHFGMEDPATTGEILGGLSIILPLYDNFLTISPDFEKQVIEGILKGNGKIYLWSIVKIAIKVLFNKNLIKVGKKVKTIIEA